jgi:hypothetical protein
MRVEKVIYHCDNCGRWAEGILSTDDRYASPTMGPAPGWKTRQKRVVTYRRNDGRYDEGYLTDKAHLCSLRCEREYDAAEAEKSGAGPASPTSEGMSILGAVLESLANAMTEEQARDAVVSMAQAARTLAKKK